LDNYKIAETAVFSKKINSKKYNHIYKQIIEYIYPMIRHNPFFGPNIKKLKGEYQELYRFRTGDYRLFYKIDEQESIVFMVNVANRQDAYK
jgi:mRNA interferase RelE/StbE